MPIHLLLCALLAIQQPSVVLRSAAWQQNRALTSAQGNGLGSMVEEEKLPGMREPSRPRVYAFQAPGGHGRVPPRLRVATRHFEPDLPGQDIARSHWRKASLPPRAFMDDDPHRPV